MTYRMDRPQIVLGVRSAFGQRLYVVNLIRPRVAADMADRVVLLEDVPGSLLFGGAGEFHLVAAG